MHSNGFLWKIQVPTVHCNKKPELIHQGDVVRALCARARLLITMATNWAADARAQACKKGGKRKPRAS